MPAIGAPHQVAWPPPAWRRSYGRVRSLVPPILTGHVLSPPSGRAWGKVTAWVFFRRCDHRHGRAPWPGPHRGPAGRAAGPPASGARAGPSAGGYGSAALCLISSAGHPIPRGAVAGSPALVARPWWPGSSGNGTDSRLRRASPEGACQVEYRSAATGHPKVLPGRLGCGVRGQGELPGPRGGLGAVGGPELAQDVGHMLLTVSSAGSRGRCGQPRIQARQRGGGAEPASGPWDG
jgi:hypothetical protein